MVKTVDEFMKQGCGRCDLWNTHACKIHKWEKELSLLRSIMRASPLNEESKWGFPCYTHKGKNLILIQVTQDSCGLSFLNGALLPDPKGLLQKPGEFSRIAKVIRYTSCSEIEQQKEDIISFIQKSIEVQDSGAPLPKSKDTLCHELEEYLNRDPALQHAFFSLTLGRQRGYNIFISSAKQPKTRIRRIEKYRETILAGKGMHDDWKKR